MTLFAQRNKIKLLLLLILLAGSRLSAQTNNARMLSGTNTVTICSPYIVQASDQTKLLVFSTVASCSVILPAANTFGPGVLFSMKNDGAGTVTINPASGTISGG